MLRVILGVIAGFVVWTLVRLAGNDIFIALAPSFAPSRDFSVIPTSFLIFLFVLSCFCSIAAGLSAVFISREKFLTVSLLAGLLLLVGIAFQAIAWNLLPLWYHALFLISLVPMTFLGAKLKA